MIDMSVYCVCKAVVADKDHLMIISPDEGAMQRAVYFSNVLGVDMGMFYKRRDYSTIVNGKNPIVAHEFLGDDELIQRVEAVETIEWDRILYTRIVCVKCQNVRYTHCG